MLQVFIHAILTNGTLWEHNEQNMGGFGKVCLKKLPRTDKICKLLIVLVLTLESQNDNDHEIHNFKKNPICILNFLLEHVPTVYEKKK